MQVADTYLPGSIHQERFKISLLFPTHDLTVLLSIMQNFYSLHALCLVLYHLVKSVIFMDSLAKQKV